MTRKFFTPAKALICAASLGLAFAAGGAIAAGKTPWTSVITPLKSGHLIGNPKARVTVAEYISYSCHVCGSFALKGEAPLKSGYIATGKVKLEIHPIIRNALDVTATMLVQCGAPSKLPQNHAMFMASQPSWLSAAGKTSDEQRKAWMSNSAAARKAMARDLGFYALMETRDYTPAQIDQCLTNQAKADKLVADSIASLNALGIKGTPSFAINGKLQNDVIEWQDLEPLIKSALKGK